MLRRAFGCLGFAALSLTACKAPDPAQTLEIQIVETYWAVDTSIGTNHYIAPLVRFSLRNRSDAPLRAVQATATFRRRGEENLTWGSAFEQVTPAKKPLEPGAESQVELRSDARYYSTGTPEAMFEHSQFKDATVEVYVRIGASGWVKLAESPVTRRIGSLKVEH